MQFSYNWLQDFFETPLPGAEEVAEQLGLHSFELEGVEKLDNGDLLIDWDVLPNRSSDCLCYEGIAREISAVFEIPYKSYLNDLEEKTYDTKVLSSDRLNFSLDTDLVVRATKRYAEGIVVKDSPDWLRVKLESIGQKSINNVVDITNYVMWVTGQPVHAFDYDKLGGAGDMRAMSIRHAKEGEIVVDLTGETHELDSSMIVVADEEKALDVAGIKGGNNSGVDEGTTRIILSACNYDFKNIRHTSRKLKLQTDASKRYENEVPVLKADSAMMLLADLIENECGGTVSNEIIDTAKEGQPSREIAFSVSQTNALLGTDLVAEQIESLLDRLHVNCIAGKAEGELVAVPRAERLDLNISQDIIEEVGRLYGLFNIPETPIEGGFKTPPKNMTKHAWYRTGDVLTQRGFYEVYNRSLVGGGVVKLANSLNANADSLRSSLLPLLAEKAERNFAHTETPHFFEIGKVFTDVTDGIVDEHWSFAGVLGRRKIKEKQRAAMFYETKGCLEQVLDALLVKNVNWKESNVEDWVAELQIDGEVIGHVGVNMWEINFEKLIAHTDASVDYHKPSKYPKMDRDVAVFVPMDTAVADVAAIIEGAGPEKCISTELFDVYEDAENNRKSLAFRLVFQCWTETLSDEYTNAEMDKVYTALKSQPGFEIR